MSFQRSDIPRRFFTDEEQEMIVAAIGQAEKKTSGEIRICLERDVNEPGGDPYERAREVFAKLEMHQTAERNGVLVYLAVRSRRFAIVGDEKLHQHLGENYWVEVRDLIAQDFAKGNVKARVRMVTQYEVVGLLGGLVLGTDHSAENVTGFYTKYGDGACDLVPLFGLNKRQIRLLARQLGAPDQIITKAPMADLETLAPGKADEAALGLTYDQIDDFLEGKEIDAEASERLIHIFVTTAHKRQPIASIYDH